MATPITDNPVCVTGASGFIASHIVRDLLADGYRVRGTVRDASSDKYGYLTDLPGAGDRLELVTADLNQPDSFRDAVAGCEYVIHTASPYVITVDDPQRDLVDPAVQGTRGVLEACAASGGVKRLIVTSSMAAVTDSPPDRELTEDDWNEESSLSRNPYYYSKTLAERQVWSYVDESKPEFDCVVVNPFLVIGPSLGPGINESNKVLIDLLTGGYPGIIRIGWGIVDVRDVSRAHIRAMERPDADGRYLCAAGTLTMRELRDMLGELGYADYKLPKLGMDFAGAGLLVKLGTLFQPKGVRSYLSTNLGRIPRFDNSKIKRDLGIEFRDLRETIAETTADLERWEHIPPRED